MIAAWADISDALTAGDPAVLQSEGWGFQHLSGVVSKVNVGYFWMLINCLTSAAYVGLSFARAHNVANGVMQVLTMRRRIKITGFSDWDSMFYNNLLSIPVLAFFSIVAEEWSAANLARNL